MHTSGPVRKNIDVSLALLKILGLCLDGEEVYFGTKFYWIYSICANALIGGTFVLGLFMYLFTNFRNFDLVAGNAYFALFFCSNFAKSVFFLKGWSHVKDLIKQLDQEEFQPKNKIEENFVVSNFKIHRVANLFYRISVVLLIPLWLISPLVLHSEEPTLPFPSWYPFDLSSPRYFAVAYLHQILGTCYCSLAVCSLDFVIFGFMACLAAECDLLCFRLKSISIGCTMAEELICHMRHHLKILKFAEDANDFLGTLNFVQFALSNLAICTTMFELTVVPPFSLQFFGVLQTQLSLLNQLLIYCYFGNKVFSQSVEISEALYATPWIDGGKNCKKNILFFIMRTQRPIKILALNLFLLSLPTFTSILRSSYSLFAMLHQTQLKKTE